MRFLTRLLALGIAALFAGCLNMAVAAIPIGYISSFLCAPKYEGVVWDQLNESYIKASASTAPRLERLQREDVVQNTYQVQGMEKAMKQAKVFRPFLSRIIRPTHLLMYPHEPEVSMGFAISETTLFPFVARVYYGLLGKQYSAYGCRTYLCLGRYAILYEDIPVELAKPGS